jgi:hypothetical protein
MVVVFPKLQMEVAREVLVVPIKDVKTLLLQPSLVLVQPVQVAMYQQLLVVELRHVLQLDRHIQVLEHIAHLLFTTCVHQEQLLVEDATYQVADVLDHTLVALQEHLVRTLADTLALVVELLAEAHALELQSWLIPAPAASTVEAPQLVVEPTLTVAPKDLPAKH